MSVRWYNAMAGLMTPCLNIKLLLYNYSHQHQLVSLFSKGFASKKNCSRCVSTATTGVSVLAARPCHLSSSTANRVSPAQNSNHPSHIVLACGLYSLPFNIGTLLWYSQKKSLLWIANRCDPWLPKLLPKSYELSTCYVTCQMILHHSCLSLGRHYISHQQTFVFGKGGLGKNLGHETLCQKWQSLLAAVMWIRA